MCTVVFLRARDDSWKSIKGRILHNILHNTFVGILPACSGWEQLSLCWSENNPEHKPEAAETVGNLQHKKKMLHTNYIKQTRKTFKRGGWKMKQGNTVLFSWLWVNNLKQTFKHTPKNTSPRTKLNPFLGEKHFTINGWYSTSSRGKTGGELPDESTITGCVPMYKRCALIM